MGSHPIKFLMRLLPRSLLWRTFAIIALLLIVSVIAWVQLFRFYEREPRAHQVSQQIIAILNLTRAALVSSRPEARDALMREISATERIEIYPSEAGEQLEPAPDRPMPRLIAALVREKAGAGTRFAFRRNGTDGLWVSFRIDEDEYWVRMERERIEPPLPWDWLGWAALALFLSLIGAYFLVLHITQPLRALAGAARAVGRGEPAPPLPEAGAREIAEVAGAFNQMTQDLKMQEENRALVLAGISHDLRTPLARLRLGVEMSSDTLFREGMVADIEQMDQVIGQFLDFARAGRDESALTETELDLTDLARELHTHYTSLGHHITLDTPAPVYANLRPAVLKRALMNLIDNALRYAGDAPPVEIAVHQKDRATVIEIRDRGPGIPPASAERLKQPFTRLDDARGSSDGTVEGKPGGSGLGLAIVDRIVRQHGGRFDLLPRPGGGLVSRITLPPHPYLPPAVRTKEPA